MSRALHACLTRPRSSEPPVEQPPYLFRSDVCRRGGRFDVKEISPHRLLLTTDQGDVQITMTHITRHKIYKAVDRYKIENEEAFMRTMQLVVLGRDTHHRLEWEFQPKEKEQHMESAQTERGFNRFEFKDANGVNCSLQESSAIEPAIWLGRDNPVPVVEGLPLTRMHLTREKVAELLPHLQKFVETGEL